MSVTVQQKPSPAHSFGKNMTRVIAIFHSSVRGAHLPFRHLPVTHGHCDAKPKVMSSAYAASHCAYPRRDGQAELTTARLS